MESFNGNNINNEIYVIVNYVENVRENSQSAILGVTDSFEKAKKKLNELFLEEISFYKLFKENGKVITDKKLEDEKYFIVFDDYCRSESRIIKTKMF